MSMKKQNHCRLLPFNVLPRFSNDRNHIDEENKGQKVNKSVNKISPPIQKFLDCSIDEFRVNDVPGYIYVYFFLTTVKEIYKL